jgi:hypothetical protein
MLLQNFPEIPLFQSNIPESLHDIQQQYDRLVIFYCLSQVRKLLMPLPEYFPEMFKFSTHLLGFICLIIQNMPAIFYYLHELIMHHPINLKPKCSSFRNVRVNCDDTRNVIRAVPTKRGCKRTGVFSHPCN